MAAQVLLFRLIIGNGGITDFVIDNAGTGYEIGDDLVFNNANTNGGAECSKKFQL